MACNGKPKTVTLTGDLYFSLFRMGNFYNQPDSIVEGFKMLVDTLTHETADEEQRRFLNQYKRLKDEKLLYQPYVDIITEKDSVMTLFLETKDYDEIKKFKREDLQDKGKKIRIVAKVRKLDGRLFYCVGLVKVAKVDGQTRIKSRKWKIEDYN